MRSRKVFFIIVMAVMGQASSTTLLSHGADPVPDQFAYITEVSVPETVQPGESFTITITVDYDFPLFPQYEFPIWYELFGYFDSGTFEIDFVYAFYEGAGSAIFSWHVTAPMEDTVLKFTPKFYTNRTRAYNGPEFDNEIYRFEGETFEIQVGQGETFEIQVGQGETNEKPIASFTVSPESPVDGDTLEIDANGSYDLDGDIVDYKWSSNGDEDTEMRGEPSWSWPDMPAGAYEITLVVVDDKGEESDPFIKTVDVYGGDLIISSAVKGVVADGVSSALIMVTVPTTENTIVRLTDGVTTLNETTVNGVAVFRYVPDTQALGLSPSNIPQQGRDITLTVETEGLVSELTLKIYRRPVLLVHGLWSSGEACWGKGKMKTWLENAGFNVSIISYPSVSKAIITVAEGEFADRIDEIQRDYLSKGINATKIDIVAHSMGGLISRQYINGFTSAQENVDIKTLITVGTPHAGSPLVQMYFDALKGEFPVLLPSEAKVILQSLLVFWTNVGEPGKIMTPGPALLDLVPDSPFLDSLNAAPNNPNVDYYTIAGTDNWQSRKFGFIGAVQDYIEIIEFVDPDLLAHGDGVVPLTSARMASRFRHGYYVDEGHTNLGKSPHVFEIVEKLLVEKESEVPDIYRIPKEFTLKMTYFLSSTDDEGNVFTIYRSLGSEDPKPLLAGESIGFGEKIEIRFDRWDPDDPDKMASYLEGEMRASAIFLVSDANLKKVGEIAVKQVLHPLTYEGDLPREAPAVWFQVLSPSTIYISSIRARAYSQTSDLRILKQDRVRVIHDSWYITSPDPELLVSLDDSNVARIKVIDGTVTVWDYFSNSVDVAEGQMINVYPDEPLEEPSSFDVSTVEKWWSIIYSAQLTDVEAPSQIRPGETFDIVLIVDYEFSEPTEISPGIYDIETKTWIDEASEILMGEGTKTYIFELTAPEEETTWALEASVWYYLEDEWTYDEEKRSEVFEISVVDEEEVSVIEEEDSEGGGIPGFPYFSIALGLVLVSLLLKRFRSVNQPILFV